MDESAKDFADRMSHSSTNAPSSEMLTEASVRFRNADSLFSKKQTVNI
jgi:hypothetical protein